MSQNFIDVRTCTRISGSKWVKPYSSKFRTTGTVRSKLSFVPAYMTIAAIARKLTNQHLDMKMRKINPKWRTEKNICNYIWCLNSTLCSPLEHLMLRTHLALTAEKPRTRVLASYLKYFSG